jgi:hypothetical protein
MFARGFKEERPFVCAQTLLYDAMLKHPTVTRYISEDQFCKDIYSNVILDLDKMNLSEEDRKEMFRWAMQEDDALDASMSFRSAGGFVADLRNDLIGTSEDYMDWYCSQGEGYLSATIEAIYDEFGIKWSEWRDNRP